MKHLTNAAALADVAILPRSLPSEPVAQPKIEPVAPASPNVDEASASAAPAKPVVHFKLRRFPSNFVIMVLAGIAFLYFISSFILPIVLACVAGMALKPLIRGLARCHIPRPLGAALVLGGFVTLTGMAFVHLGRPAMAWVEQAPEHMAELKQRVQKIFRPAAQLSQVAAAVTKLGTSDDDQKATTPVEVKDGHAATTMMNFTGGLLARMGETLVLLYLLLASGDTFLTKLVRVMPTRRDKHRAVAICHEIQHNISQYLFSVSMINLGLGLAVSAGLHFLGVPNPAMWGMLAALFNYIPYFGPIAGVALLSIAGLLTFDTLTRGLLPPLWYLLLHLAESNFISPILLGRRFLLNPVVVFVSLIFWTWIWGVAGALLSVPILISLKAICDRVPPLSPVSEFLVH